MKALLLNSTQDKFVGIERERGFFDKQKQHGPEPEKYDIPGGRIEFGEEPEQGLRREIEEEIGLSLPNHCQFQPLTAANIVCKPDLQIVRITYVAMDYAIEDLAELTLGDEHQALAWVSLAPADNLHPLLNEAIKALLKNQPELQSVWTARQMKVVR